MDIVISFTAKVAEYAVEPIGRQAGYLLSYKGNFKELADHVKNLEAARERLNHQVEEERRNGKEVESFVVNWLEEVNKAIEIANQLQKDRRRAKVGRSTWSLFPNLSLRHRLSRDATKIVKDVVEVWEKGNFDRIGYLPPLLDFSISSATRGGEKLEERESFKEGVVKALKDLNSRIIGVYGLGGVGKTTLVKEVAQIAKQDNLFDKVVIAHVSQTPDIKTIQGEIADLLGLRFQEETVAGRAERLRQRIKAEKTILVILDDIWTRLDLEKVGIPYGNDHNGCKLLMTSRNQDVLQQMDAQKDFTFRLELLSEAETLSLFQSMAGDVFKDNNFKAVATQVAQKCAGLPLSIVTVARALRNKDIYAWKDALTQLENNDHAGMDAITYSALELSYNSLENDEIMKPIFLPFATQGCTSGKLQLVRDAAIEDFPKRSEVTLAVPSPPKPITHRSEVTLAVPSPPKPITHSCWHKYIDLHIASDVGRDPPPSTVVDNASIYVSLPTTDSDSSTQASASIQPTHDNLYIPSTFEHDPYVPPTQDSPYIPSTYEHRSSSTRPTLHCLDDNDDTQLSSQDLNIDEDTDSGDDDIPTLPVQGEVDEEVKWLPDGRVVIKPVGNTFLPTTESAHAITHVIKENFKQPWITWGEIRKNDADSLMMFDSFRNKCVWLPEHTELCGKNFHHRATRRKTNRASTKGGNMHTGGSIKTRLRRRVQLHKLHHPIHVRRDNDSGEEQFIDQQSREAQEQFQLVMDRYHAQQAASGSDTQFNPEKLGRIELTTWADKTCGKKKGHVYGIGSLSSCYRRGVSYLDNNEPSSSAANTSRSHDAKWQRKIDKANRKVKVAMKQCQDLKAQMKQHMSQMIEQQRQAMEQQMNQMMELQMRHMMEMMQQQQQWRPLPLPIPQFYQEAAWAVDSQGMGGPSPSQQHRFFSPPSRFGQQYYYKGLPGQHP